MEISRTAEHSGGTEETSRDNHPQARISGAANRGATSDATNAESRDIVQENASGNKTEGKTSGTLKTAKPGQCSAINAEEEDISRGIVSRGMT